MLRKKNGQHSIFSILYDRISDNNILRKVESAVDFNFVNEILKESYCENFGKPAKEILDFPKFIEQKGIRSLIDKDARVGLKSKTQNFFGYKTEFTMLTEEKIITSINVYDGVYVDGTNVK